MEVAAAKRQAKVKLSVKGQMASEISSSLSDMIGPVAGQGRNGTIGMRKKMFLLESSQS